MFLGRFILALIASSVLLAENPLMLLFEDAWTHSSSNESGNLAHAAEQAFKSGQHQEAIKATLAAAQMERAAGQLNSAGRFEHLAQQLETQLDERRKALRIPENLSRDIGAQLVAFDQVAGPISNIAVVRAEVQPFLRAVRRSADSPLVYKERMRAEQILHAGSWMLETDRSKCIFLAGSGKDMARVSRIKTSYEDQGYKVFFYSFCAGPGGELCDSEIVGSYAKSAGQLFLVDTPSAAESIFVLPEMMNMLSLDQGKPVVLMITPEQLRVAAQLPGQLVQATAFNVVNDSNKAQ